MNKAKKKGALAARLEAVSPKSLKDSMMQQQEAHTKEGRESTQLWIDSYERRRSEVSAEKQAKGNPSSTDIKENLLKAILMMGFVSISLVGEYIFMAWTLQPFDLPPWQLGLLALALTLLLMEGVNFFLTAFRIKFPKADNYLFLLVGLTGLYLIFSLISDAAFIRGNLYRYEAMAKASNSLEGIVSGAEAFIGGNSHIFARLMVALTTAITIIGGVSYHEARNRLFKFWGLWRLDREARKVERKLISLRRKMLSLDNALADFTTELDIGYAMEKARQARMKQMPNFFWRVAGMFKLVNGAGRGKVFSIILALGALVGVFFLAGVARGETVVFLDLSKSAGMAAYSGKETEFQKDLKGIKGFFQNGLKPGERIKLIGIHARSYMDPYIILEAELSSKKGSLGEILAREKLWLLKKLGELDLKPTSDSTDVFGAMHLASALFSSSKDKKLLIFSDLRHNSRDLDIETPNIIQVDPLLKKVRDRGLIASLDGASVWCLGVHPIG